MFTFYHAIVFVAIFVLGMYIGYAIGNADGRDHMAREIDEYNRTRGRIRK